MVSEDNAKQKNLKETYGAGGNLKKFLLITNERLKTKINFIINDPDCMNKYSNYIHKRFKNENFNDRTLKKIFNKSKS